MVIRILKSKALFLFLISDFRCTFLTKLYAKFKKTSTPCRTSYNLSDATSNLLFTTCGFIQEVSSCGTKSVACLNQNGHFVGYGNRFVDAATPMQSNADDKEITLKSTGGQICENGKTHVIYLHFRCYDKIQVDKPIVVEKTKYEIHVEIMHPKCTPQCIYRVKDDIINVRALEDVLHTTSINGTDENSQLFFSLCAPREECGFDNFSCAKINGSLKILANEKPSLERLDLEGIVFKGQSGPHKSDDYIEISIKCNWPAKTTIARYRPHSVKSKQFKVEVESPQGCIKPPTMDCLLNDYPYRYNLNGLYKKEGYIVDIPDDHQRFLLNVCGPLQMNTTNFCTETDAQICLHNTTKNQYLSIGVMSQSKVTNGGLELHFKGASACALDPSSTYETIIKLQCSFNNDEPIFKRSNGTNCVHIFTWQTNYACPSEVFHANDLNKPCALSDHLFTRDLSNLPSSVESTPNYSLHFNFCGTINRLCNNQTSAICYASKNDERVVGFPGAMLSSENRLLHLHFFGETCELGFRTETHVRFICDYYAVKSHISVDISTDGCRFEILVHTSLACDRPPLHDCSINLEEYDVQELSLTDADYRIKSDSNNPNEEFVLNICRPLLLNAEHLCKNGTTFCMIDKSKPSIIDKYVSISWKAPKLENKNGTAMATYTVGSYMKGCIYEALIYLRCSKDKEENPTFLRKGSDNCKNEFIWETKHACPKFSGKVLDENKKMQTQQYASTIKPTTVYVAPSKVIRNPVALNVSPVPKSKEHVEIVFSESKSNVMKKQKACTIPTTNISLEVIKPFHVYSPKFRTNYTIDVNNLVSSCHGVVCRDATRMASISEDCPNVTLVDSSKVAKLFYNTLEICNNLDSYQAEIVLECGSEKLPKLAIETKCFISIVYPLKDICLVFHESNEESSSSGVVIASSVSLLALVLIPTVIFIKKLKNNGCKRRSYSEIAEEKESMKLDFIYGKNAQV